MPRPILKKIDIIQLINRSLDFIKLSSKNSINLFNKQRNNLLMAMKISLIEFLLI